MSQALYRKYRSKSLDEIFGQSHVTDVLRRSLEQGRVAHAYLLTGPRGVGKTSIARILAYEINKLPYDENGSHLDIIEIDAASNNGVEDVRSLREKVQIAPVSASKKIYIIDEVHMLSKAAFNALLKTLEEPPEHAVFILATTDVDKLPATIISRVQRFSLHAISHEDAVKHLKHIAKEEKIKIEDKALEIIASRGDGSFRDSISLLDQLRSLSGDKETITAEIVEQSLGLAPGEHIEKLLAAYEAKDLKAIVELIDESEEKGVQPGVLVSQLTQKIRSNIAEKPQLLTLLDQLLEVAKSSQPNIKLLTILAGGAVIKPPKNAALVSPTLEISAPVETLKQTPAKQKPPIAVAKEVEPPAPIVKQKKSETDKQEVPVIPNIPINIDNFEWEKLIEYIKQHSVGLYSVLSKCAYDLQPDKLVLYTNNAFYKKKLDDSKQRINLSKALVEIEVGDIQIETIGTPPPPKDSTAAAVAAIMGGGQEVTVDG